jgi:hypothetical protein
VTNRDLDALDSDALVLRELSRLPSYSPSRGFQDRVMARVTLPRPTALVLLGRAGAWVTQPRRAVAFATAYAFGVLVAVSLAAPWVVAHAALFGAAASWVAGQVGGWLDSAVLAVAGWAVRSGVAGALRSLGGEGVRLWVGVALAAGAYAASGYGLHVLLKAPRRSDAQVARSL